MKLPNWFRLKDIGLTLVLFVFVFSTASFLFGIDGPITDPVVNRCLLIILALGCSLLR